MVQLIGEKIEHDVFDDIARFCKQVGLPITLNDMNIEATEENIEVIAKASMHSNWEREPFPVDWPQVAEWIKEANTRGANLV